MFNVQNLKISKFNFAFGPDFEFLGPNKRVNLIFEESGRPDSRAKKVPSYCSLVTTGESAKPMRIVTYYRPNDESRHIAPKRGR